MTHLLTGACIGRAGFNRKTAYATLAATIAAEAADLDMFWHFHGPAAGFEHHRGITHSLIGAPFVALFAVGVVWIFDRLRRKRPPIKARWLFLWCIAWIAALSHVFLDFTTNYGIRPLLPFDSHWYALSLTVVWEPVMFGALILGLVIPEILGLADREIGARRVFYRGRGWAIAALVVVAAMILLRWAEHRRAIHLAAQSGAGAPVIRLAAEPYAFNPFHWLTVVETKNTFLTRPVNTWSRSLGEQTVIYKPPVTPAVTAAEQSKLGRAFMDWAQFPVVTDQGPADTLNLRYRAQNPLDSVVTFHDMRYAYTALAHMRGGGYSPIFGITVMVSPEGEVVSAELNHRDWNLH